MTTANLPLKPAVVGIETTPKVNMKVKANIGAKSTQNLQSDAAAQKTARNGINALQLVRLRLASVRLLTKIETPLAINIIAL